MAPSEDGAINVFVGTLVGALVGLFSGFIVSHMLRYVSFLTGRYLGGFSWVIIGALAGAVVFGCVTAWRDEG